MTGGRSSVSVVGGAKLRRALRGLAHNASRALGAGLYLEGNNIMADAKERAPLDLGTLRGSGYVTTPHTSGHETTVELGFGGPAKDYAVVQHEELGFLHPEGGEAKYLERAVDARSANAARNIGAFAIAALKRGTFALPPSVHVTHPDNAPPAPETPRRKRRKRGA